jgi:hypothetical protein
MPTSGREPRSITYPHRRRPRAAEPGAEALAPTGPAAPAAPGEPQPGWANRQLSQARRLAGHRDRHPEPGLGTPYWAAEAGRRAVASGARLTCPDRRPGPPEPGAGTRTHGPAEPGGAPAWPGEPPAGPTAAAGRRPRSRDRHPSLAWARGDGCRSGSMGSRRRRSLSGLGCRRLGLPERDGGRSRPRCGRGAGVAGGPGERPSGPNVRAGG